MKGAGQIVSTVELNRKLVVAMIPRAARIVPTMAPEARGGDLGNRSRARHAASAGKATPHSLSVAMSGESAAR
jgi:hypothetical protein